MLNHANKSHKFKMACNFHSISLSLGELSCYISVGEKYQKTWIQVRWVTNGIELFHQIPISWAISHFFFGNAW